MMEEIIKAADNLEIERYVMPLIDSNMFVIRSQGEAVIIDPYEDEWLMESLKVEDLRTVYVLLTHEHIDHISGVNRLKEGFPQTEVICSSICGERIMDPGKNLAKFWDVLFMDKNETVQAAAKNALDKDYTCRTDTVFEKEREFAACGHRFRLAAAPGHSPGGMLIYLDECPVFTGANLVKGNGVICRFPGGNRTTYAEYTLPMISELPDSVLILPGHGKPGNLEEMRQYLRIFDRNDRKSVDQNTI